MKLLFGFLAEAALNKNGQLYILGTFDRIGAAEFPFIFPQFALVLKCSAHPSELGKHSINISLVDSDGRAVVQQNGSHLDLNGEIEIGPNKIGNWVESSAELILNLGGFGFSKADTYSFTIKVDGRHAGDVRFFVVNEMQSQQAA